MALTIELEMNKKGDGEGSQYQHSPILKKGKREVTGNANANK
jgi:hypothetical protein